MKPTILFLACLAVSFLPCHAQSPKASSAAMASSANQFLKSLSPEQVKKAQFLFDADERFNWHYIPKERMGIPLNDLNKTQLDKAMALLRTGLSNTGYTKASSIMQLEPILKQIENRADSDHYRDPGKYYFSIFGNPSDSIWGWRLEGHHISFNFSSDNNRIVSGTPGFLGSNPAIVLAGPEKGKHILKDETELGLGFVKSLDAKQTEKAVISEKAPGEILTTNSRKAMLENPVGILYSELTADQKKLFMQLLSIYIHRYSSAYAADMMQEIETAGLIHSSFAWAGEEQTGPGHPHYYRIQGPTIIIEYDNTQNNANHIHTVIRDLLHDFGGDELMEHYQHQHHHL